jgi:dUTP pyrophosphatase
MLQVKKFTDHAFLPTKGSKYAAGTDLYAIEDVDLQPQTVTILKTGIGLKFPETTYGQISSRSSLASKGIVVHGGVIDPDYQGEIKIILYNFNESKYSIYRGDKIAQVICKKFELIDEVKLIDDFEEITERNVKGFGSSGK